MTYFQEEAREAPAAGAGGSGGTGNTGGKNDLKKIQEIILAALPCLCAFLLMGVYALELFPRLNLAAVNLICLFLACLKLLPGIVGAVNRRKAGSFASSLAIALAALAVNLRGQMPQSLSSLSAWEVLWAGMAAVSAVCLAAVLLRLLRWSQKNWEQEWEAVQSRRRERRENRREWWRNWRQYWAGRLTARHEYARGRAEARRDYKKQVEETRRANKLKRKNLRWTKKLLEKLLETWEWQQIWKEQTEKQAEEQTHPQSRGAGQSRESRRIRRILVSEDVPQWGWWIIIPVSFAAVCTVAVLLFWIPTIQGLSDGVEDWFQTVRDVVIPLMMLGANADAKELENISTGLAVIYYLMIVILCIIILVVAVYLTAMLLKRIWTGTLFDNTKKAPDNGFHLLATYANSFSLLLVSFIALYALSSGKISFDKITEGWSVLFFTVLFILMMLTAFEIVRLVLEQCGQADSVLKRIIYLFFIAVLDFLSEVIFGLLKGLHIENAVSSLLSLVLPGDSDEVPARALKKIKRMFQNEIDAVRETVEDFENINATAAGSGAGQERETVHRDRFFRRKIWRKQK